MIDGVEGKIHAGGARGGESLDQAGEALIVRITTSCGRVGYAECLHSPRAALAFLSSEPSSAQTRGIVDVIVGRDPRDPDLTSELATANLSNARGGIAAGVIAAVDAALWDLRAQLAGVPLWELLWGPDKDHTTRMYATVYTGPCGYGEAVDRMVAGIDAVLGDGYDAVKVEPLVECVPESRIAEFASIARGRLGRGRDLLVDVYHRFDSSDDVLALATALQPSAPLLVETPLPLDDLEGWSRLKESSIPVAGCELYEKPREFAALLRYGHVDVVQPWPARLGVSGTLDVLELVAAADRQVLLAGWNASDLGRMLNFHLARGLGGPLHGEERPSRLYEPLPLAPPGSNDTSSSTAGGRRPGLGVEVDWDWIGERSSD